MGTIAVTATVTDAAGNAASATVAATLGDQGHDPTVARWLMDGEHFPDGFTVPEGEVWAFSHDADATVTSAGNVIVHGTLRMGHCHCTHTLRFVGVDESAFVGGGMEPLASDVGLWVTHHGILDAVGEPRVGWNRTGIDPTWMPGDEIRTAPIAKGDYDGFPLHTPGDPVPTVVDPWGLAHPTEAFNLTRSVVIGGEAGGRAHVFIHSGHPQTIRYARFEHLGPRGPAAGNQDSSAVLGRYPVHFHHCGDASRGSVVEGCVVEGWGSRAFVPHSSHGITFRDCVAYRILDEAYWWDRTQLEASRDTVWEHCAAFAVSSDGLNRMGAFRIGSGTGNTVRDCVAAGVLGGKDTSGFEWPELDHDVWVAEDLTAHNNRGDGIFVWQNDQLEHVVTRPTAFHNGSAGIQHGAYGNAYRYFDVRAWGNGSMGDVHSQALPKEVHVVKQQWNGVRCDHLMIGEHNKNFDATNTSTLVLGDLRCSRVTVDESMNLGSGTYELRCAPGFDLEPSDFTVVLKRSVVRVVRSDGSTYTL